jgi:hypothetical protein
LNPLNFAHDDHLLLFYEIFERNCHPTGLRELSNQDQKRNGTKQHQLNFSAQSEWQITRHGKLLRATG